MTRHRRQCQDPVLLEFDDLLDSSSGIARSDFQSLMPRLIGVRDEVAIHDVELWSTGGSIPDEKQPLDAGFIELPSRLLAEYESDPQASELGRILSTTRRLSDQVDRVVLLGIGGSYMGARAIMEACCPPYFNELGRGSRAGQPRLYFEGNNVDNDSTQGLLHLLEQEQDHDSINGDWALVVISKSGGTLETGVAFRQFLRALRATGITEEQLAERIVPVTGSDGKLARLVAQLNCPEVFQIPDGVGGRFSALTPVGLVPAAFLGLDVVALLQGAATMNRRFVESDPEDNIVLQWVALCHLMEQLQGATVRVLNVWSKSLEAFGLWYDQLLAESLGKQNIGATPLTVVNTRDLHSRAQQHQEGCLDKFHTHVVIDQCRSDPLSVGTIGTNEDDLDQLADTSLPQIMDAAVQGTLQAYQQAGRGGCMLKVPEVNEHSLGQLMQLAMLATVVEGRLLGINPYGQPGVEAYKQNMNRILGRD